LNEIKRRKLEESTNNVVIDPIYNKDENNNNNNNKVKKAETIRQNDNFVNEQESNNKMDIDVEDFFQKKETHKLR